MMDYSSIVNRFGNVINQSIVITLQLYGDLLRNTLTHSLLNQQIKNGSPKRVINGLINAAGITDVTGPYFVSRMEYLKEYILKNDPNDYSEFINILNDETYSQFIEDFQQYRKHLVQYIEALNNPKVDQTQMVKKFSEWYSEKRNINPFKYC